MTNKNYVSKLKIVCQKFVFLLIFGGIKMIDYLRNLFISWFNKILNWFSERQKKEMNTKKEIPFGKNKHADDDRQKRISEGFQALDEGCKSIANLRAEIEMSQTNNDLDAPVPANKQNNIKNIGGNNMGNFWGPKTPEECQQEIEKHEQQMKEEMAKIKIKKMAKIKDLEKKKLELENKEGVAPIKPVGQEKVLSSNISPISMRSNNDNSNWIDPNDLNNTFEYQNVDKKALNAMGTKIKQDVKQEIKKDMDDRFAESTNKINQIQEQVNKNTEDMKEVKKKVDKIQEEQIDIKKMLAEMKEERKDTKRMLAKMEEDKKKSEENQKAHDEIMAMLWNKLDEWNGIKEPTREINDNRESTNTSLSSFKYKNPFRNNSQIPKMERADMAHSYDENQ